MATMSQESRSRIMTAIKSKDTKPELMVRKALHARGFRYSLHRRNLPGRPDIVLTRHSCVIQVQGCFWHGHDCPRFRWPRTRPEFWHAKIKANRERDCRNEGKLRALGWRVVTVWECELEGNDRDLMKFVERLEHRIVGRE